MLKGDCRSHDVKHACSRSCLSSSRWVWHTRTTDTLDRLVAETLGQEWVASGCLCSLPAGQRVQSSSGCLL